MQPQDPARLPVAGDQTQLVSLLEKAPPEEDRQFETQLTSLIVTLPECIDQLREIIRDTSQSKQVRYAAFFAVATAVRRRKDPSALLRLLSLYEEEFGDHGTFEHLYSMALRLRNAPGDLVASLDHARLAKHKLPNHTGVLHNFAEIVITACEDGEPLRDRARMLQEAEDALKTAILVEPRYAKFYCTYGRLAALQQEYGEARTRISRAVDLEDSRENDYWARVTEYQFHLLQIRIRESTTQALGDLERRVNDLRTDVQHTVEKTARSLEEFDSSLKEAQSRHLEFLAFFSAIVALVIAGMQLANRPAMNEVAGTLLLLGGVLLTSFAALGLLVRDSMRRSLIVLAVGAAMCAGSVLLW